MNIQIIEKDISDIQICIKCSNRNSDKVLKLKEYLESFSKQIEFKNMNIPVTLDVNNIIYCEYVNRKVFVYTATKMYVSDLSLFEFEEKHNDLFRCSKNTIINIRQITQLQSEISGTILATLSTDEKIIISRYYASKLRKIMKEKRGK